MAEWTPIKEGDLLDGEPSEFVECYSLVDPEDHCRPRPPLIHDDFYLEPEEKRAPHGWGFVWGVIICVPAWLIAGAIAVWVLG